MILVLVASNVLLWMLVLTLCAITLACVRALGAVNQQLHQAQSGVSSTPAILGQLLPDVSLYDENDLPIRLIDLHPNPGIIFVVTPDCEGCVRLMRDTRDDIEASTLRGVPITVVVLAGNRQTIVGVRIKFGLPRSVPMLRDGAGEATEKWQVQITPLVLVLKQGRVFYMGRAPSAEWVRKELLNYAESSNDIDKTSRVDLVSGRLPSVQ